jgi:endonuclease/exonuclease/phosphatase family metal-dependent hydrolase
MNDAGARLRVATYNVYKANYLDRAGPRGGTLRDDFAALSILREADVLALQEATVESDAAGSVIRDAVHELVPHLRTVKERPRHTLFHGVPHGTGRRWGVAMVTREPAEFEAIDLPRPFWSPWQRGGVLARIGPWIVVTAHLEVWPLGASARRQQMRALLAAIDKAGPSGTPVILTGDFNCQRGGPHDLLVEAGFAPALDGRQPTWSLAGVHLRLDHIYVRGARVLAAGIAGDARGSDHRPLWAEVGL